MLLAWTAIVTGLALLVWSADRFVMGASATAQNFAVPPLIIGMIIMGFGTSAPEMVVSATAAWNGNPSLAAGNAIGSNIVNIALVLGATAIVTPMAVQSRILRREFPALLIITVSVFALLSDDTLNRVDGIILFAGTFVLLGWMLWLARHSPGTDPLQQEIENELAQRMRTPRALWWTVLGLALLLASARLLVWGAVNVAQELGVSDLVIGLTIVAIGTSLPELAVSIAAALKGEHDMVIGNIIGSNMFNLLAVLGIAGIIHPAALEATLLQRDFPVMLLLTLALYAMARRRPLSKDAGKDGGDDRVKGRITRWEGALLIAIYCGYLAWLALSEIGAPAL